MHSRPVEIIPREDGELVRLTPGNTCEEFLRFFWGIMTCGSWQAFVANTMGFR